MVVRKNRTPSGARRKRDDDTASDRGAERIPGVAALRRRQGRLLPKPPHLGPEIPNPAEVDQAFQEALEALKERQEGRPIF